MIIFDLDGCLSDDRWRLHLLEEGDFDAYHEQLHLDPPMNDSWVEFAAGQGCPIYIITARPKKYHAQTMDWLARNYPEGTFEAVIMRPNGSTLPSPQLKAIQLNALKQSHGDPVMVFDDRVDVLEAYHDNCGVPVALLNQLDWEGRKPLAVARREADPVVVNRAAQILNGMATTLEERNKVYKDNWRQVPELVKVLWPDGVPAELVTLPQWHLFELILVKLTRFANADLQHPDSIHDTGVYSAIIESIIEEQSK